jgi:hypothetical protein
MSRKGDAETASMVLLAFLEERSWKQKDLQRRCGVERKTLMKVLTDLQNAGLPLDREEDPPHVYWSVPKNWFPAAVAFQGSDVEELVRLLQRAPKGKRGKRLLNRIAASATGVHVTNGRDAVLTHAVETEEKEPLAALQQSSNGHPVSTRPVRCVFRVRSPEASWAKSKMPAPFEAEELKDETKFTVVTSELTPLARFVAGLGAAAAVETDDLRRLVSELAEGTMKNVQRHRAVTAKVGDDNAFAGG